MEPTWEPDGLTARCAHVTNVAYTHLALVAIDGAAEEVAATLAADFRLHLDDTSTDRWGYLALIAARWASEGPRPALDVVRRITRGQTFTAIIAPAAVIHLHVRGDLIDEMWIVSDWRERAHWLEALADC